MKYALLLLTLALLGCSSAPTVKSWLDPVSSATITAQSQPLYLARDERTRPIDERDRVELERRTRTEHESVENAFARIELRMGDRANYQRLSELEEWPVATAYRTYDATAVRSLTICGRCRRFSHEPPFL